MKSLLVILSLILMCGVSFGNPYYPPQTVIIRQNVVPTAIIETFSPHNRITDELLIPVTKIVQVANRGNQLFVRKVKIVNGRRVQEIIVNNRVVAVVPVFNNFGYGHRNNVNFNFYGQNVLGFNDFDYRVNNQFFDRHGNLVRQFRVGNVVIVQEVVPAQFVLQFRRAFVQRNFRVLRQIRNNCQFQVY